MLVFSIVILFLEAQELHEFFPECLIFCESEIIIRISFILCRGMDKLTHLFCNLQEIFLWNLPLKNFCEQSAFLSGLFLQPLKIFQLKLFVSTGSHSRNSVSELLLLLLCKFFTLFVYPASKFIFPGSNLSFCLLKVF